MSRKTRKLIWSAPLPGMATFAIVAAHWPFWLRCRCAQSALFAQAEEDGVAQVGKFPPGTTWQ